MQITLQSQGSRRPLLALALLLMVTPTFGQGRFVLSDGSTQSEYGTPSPDRTVICPVCEEAGKKSTVRRWLDSYNPSSTLYVFRERTEARYWDEDGRYHDHELAQELLVCSSGHRFYDFDDRRCWCDWPGKRYVVLDEVQQETITLPKGMTPNTTLYRFSESSQVGHAVSYQHPFIRPEPRAATVKDSLTARVAVKPRDERFNWTFALGSLGYWGSFAADITTTKGSLERGSIERNRLFGRDNGHKVLYASNAFATAGIYGIAVYLERKGHRRAARVLLFTGTVIRTSAAIWNHNRRR